MINSQYLSDSLFDSPRTMGHHSNDFIGKGIVGRDFRIPGVDKVPKNDSKKGVKLQINLRGRGQGW